MKYDEFIYKPQGKHFEYYNISDFLSTNNFLVITN